MNKYEYISKLAEDTARKVVRNSDSWVDYLETASRIYKYSFQDQLLIYAQKKEATACAPIEVWNEKMGCWVNRGAKGIALIDTKSNYPRLRYVFDVADVHKAKNIGRAPYLWELHDEQKAAVMARLERVYGETNAGMPFEQRIIEIAGKIANDHYKEYLLGLDGRSTGARLHDTLASSIAYTVLSRCGADMDVWKEKLNFDYISDFNTLKTLSVIGSATSETCRPLLMEIGRAIVEQERSEGEKNNKKALAKETVTHYNTLKRESDTQERLTQKVVENKETEGRIYGINIRKERGLSDTESDAGRGAADQVRTDTTELPKATPERDLQRAGADGRAESTLSGDTGAGRAANGLPDGTDGESRRSGRGTESIRSDEMGSEDEQYQALSGGNSASGAGLQSLSSKAQQNMDIEKPDNGESSLSGSFLDNLFPGEKAEQIDTNAMYQQIDLFSMFTEQVVTAESTVYPRDKNGLPYDIVIEKMHFWEPERAKSEKAAHIDKSGAVNFRIIEDPLGADAAKANAGFSPKEKFRRNIEAIRTLETIESENRTATPEEQKILSQYVGWGGLADAFDESKSAWAGEYQELKSLLSDAEYASARESTLNAHYTSPVIIRSIYEALENMGFAKGNILEPAMGIGNFFGMLPEKMQDTRKCVTWRASHRRRLRNQVICLRSASTSMS